MRKPPCGNYGDIDNDGYVTEADSTLVQQYLAGLVSLTEEQLARADVNGDGVVYTPDLTLIAQYAAGLIDTFPVCEGKGKFPWGLAALFGGVVALVSLVKKRK